MWVIESWHDGKWQPFAYFHSRIAAANTLDTLADYYGGEDFCLFFQQLSIV